MKHYNWTLIFIVGFSLLIGNTLNAQLTLSGQFRPRLEFRNGYRTPTTDAAKAALFVSQRSRLTLDFVNKRVTTKLSFQDVRVWGDESQLSNTTNVAVHEAWVQIGITDNSAIRLGRQELIYDDHRLMGSVDWVQQARSHDALGFRSKKNGLSTHVILAYNNEGESLAKTDYSLSNYRSMGLLWLNKTFDSGWGASIISVTDGFEDADGKLHYRWTLGPHVKYNKNKYALTSTFYYQLGETTSEVDLSAYFFSISNMFKFDNASVGIGLDFVSGTDAMDNSNQKINSFHTLYATNHKFYGFMDYFLNIPADTKGGGLIDIYAKAKTKLGAKSSLDLHVHYFMLANNVIDPLAPSNSLDKGLGFEADAVYTIKIYADLLFKVGWSFMVPTDSMRAIKGGDDSNFNTWAWTMIVYKPTFFKSKTNEK